MTLLVNRLTHRGVTQRDANAGSNDGWGNPNPPNWQTHLSAQPCRTQAAAGHDTIEGTTTVVFIEDIRLILPLGTDITDQDRILSVTDRGITVQDGPLVIRAILTHQDHLEVVLVKVAD